MHHRQQIPSFVQDAATNIADDVPVASVFRRLDVT
jgi:hypothetical protein